MSKLMTIQLTHQQERLAKMLKALGNPVRFQIMETLAARQTCMTYEIVDSISLAQSTVSQHLKVLRQAGLIQGEIEGPATCYCIDPGGVQWLKEEIEAWLPDCCLPITPPAKPPATPPTKQSEETTSRAAGCETCS
jgi:ArsR family transcriptional regulator, arsenate/arsenite/antimonite-responsive transcriptional repressor